MDLETIDKHIRELKIFFDCINKLNQPTLQPVKQPLQVQPLHQDEYIHISFNELDDILSKN